MKKIIASTVLGALSVLTSACAPRVVPADWQGYWAQEEQVEVVSEGQTTTRTEISNKSFAMVNEAGLVTGIVVADGEWKEAPIAQVDVEEEGDVRPVRFFAENLPEDIREFVPYAPATMQRDAQGRLTIEANIAELKKREDVRTKYGSRITSQPDVVTLGFHKLSEENAARVSRHEATQ